MYWSLYIYRGLGLYDAQTKKDYFMKTTTFAGNTGKATVTINGKTQEVLSFIPELGNGKLAVVDIEVLKRITGYLPQIDFSAYKKEIMSSIVATESLEEVVEFMEREISFHKTVNLIQEVELVEVDTVSPVVRLQRD